MFFIVVLFFAGFSYSGLSFSDLVQKGLDNNKSLIIARKNLQAVEADTLLGILWSDPEFSFEVLKVESQTSPRLEIELSKEFQLGTLKPKQEASLLKWKMAQAEWNRVRVEFNWQLETAFYSWQILSQVQNAEMTNKKNWEKLLKLAEVKNEQGEISQVEINEIRSQHLAAQQELLELKHQLFHLQTQIAQLIGLPQLSDSLQVVHFDTIISLPVLSELQKKARVQNSIIQMSKIQNEINKKNIRIENKKKVPHISFLDWKSWNILT